MDVLWPMGKCIDYTWMGGGDRAVSVEAGVLMRRTPSPAAAEVGDPDAEAAAVGTLARLYLHSVQPANCKASSYHYCN